MENKDNVVSSFKYLLEKANYFHLLTDDKIIIKELNQITEENLNLIIDQYDDVNQPVNFIRSSIAKEILSENSITSDKIDEIKKLVPLKSLQNWNILFRIVYPLFYIPIKHEVEFHLKNIGNNLLKEIGIEARLKIRGFEGDRGFGDTGCWLALYNSYHRSQSTAIQLYINFYADKLDFGVLDYPENNYIFSKNIDRQNIDFDMIVNDLKNYKSLIINNSNEEMEKRYAKWLDEVDGKSKSTVESYKNRLRTTLPKKLKKIGFAGKTINSIYEIVDQTILMEILKELEKGKLSEWNKSKSVSHEASSGIKKYMEFLQNNKKNIKDNEMPNESKPLNQILYGPPGTGKTYNTINKALDILGVDYDANNREDAKHKFDKVKSDGQIEFITFHQSYGYEEFVEGIKAIPEGKEGNDSNEMIYAVQDGIFKKLSNTAEKNFYNSKSDSSLNVMRLINDFADYVDNEILQQQQVVITDANSKFKIDTYLKEVKRDTEGNFKSFITGGGATNQSLALSVIKRDYEEFLNEKIRTFHEVKPSFKSRSEYHGNAPYYFELYKTIKQYQSEQDIDYNEHSESLKPYVLIIDEINRGNISKIFGELITLIESSKRIDEDEEIRLTLPYSGELFGIPSNLHIIGTMNTADRSIAQIDTALRRRFIFEEKMPNLSLLVQENSILSKEKGLSYDENKDDLIIYENESKTNYINVRLMLKAINERIEHICDREHTIGHSYFLPLIKTTTKIKLDEIFRVNILPLLAEYFYGDWADIKRILNDNDFVFAKEKSPYLDGIKTQNIVYEVNENFEFIQYQKIYNGKVKKDTPLDHQITYNDEDMKTSTTEAR